MKTKKKSVNKVIRFYDVILAVVLIGLMTALVLSYAQLSDISRDIRICKEDIETLKSDEKKLNIEIEQKLNLRNVEDMAKNELGLSKIEKSQVHYISIVADDKIELTNSGEKESVVGNALASLVKSFNILLEYLS